MTTRAPSSSILSIALATLIAPGLLGCDEAPLDNLDAPVALRGGPGGSGGGLGNTNVIDTAEVPAIDTKGGTIHDVTLLGVFVDIDGAMIPIDANSLFVNAGTVGASVANTLLEGEAFVGSTWTFDVGGTVVSATLETVETGYDAGLHDPENPDALLNYDPKRLLYTFTYQQGGTMMPPIETCVTDELAGGRMAMFGDIDVDHDSGDIVERPDTIYFGCLSGVVGKAALYGYAPDNPSLVSLTLPEFETSTRALRADYCGDGTSYTEVGKYVTFDDHYDINMHTEAGYVSEALWTEEGALCVNRIRATGKAVSALTCNDGTILTSCGAEPTVADDWSAGMGDFWTKVP